MRVAFVLPSLRDPSGWRSAALGTIRALTRHAGIAPFLVVGRADERAAGELFPHLPRLQVPEIERLALRRPGSWAAALGGLATVRARPRPAVDLVHSLDAYPAGLVGHWVAGRARAPHVVTVLGTYGVRWRRSAPDRLAYERVLRRAAAVCPLSEGTERLLREHFGPALGAAEVTVVHPGTDLADRVSASDALERQAPDPPTLLSVGAVKPRKGYHLAIAAFAEVRARFPAARYSIVGNLDDSAYHRELLRLIDRLGLDGVELCGAVPAEELDRRYRRASVFLLTPEQQDLNFEGFGLVYLEAGAYGLPSVATRTGGVPAAVEHGVSGLLAPPGDVPAIARALLTLLGDRELARRLGRAARQRLERFSDRAFARRQAEVYRRLLARVSHRGP